MIGLIYYPYQLPYDMTILLLVTYVDLMNN